MSGSLLHWLIELLLGSSHILDESTWVQPFAIELSIAVVIATYESNVAM